MIYDNCKMILQLPKNVSLKDLYMEEDQTIWFLTWILRKCGCDQYVGQMILETPFQVFQKVSQEVFQDVFQYRHHEYLKQYIEKNGLVHGLTWIWFNNNQLKCECNWKNGLRHGIYRGWDYDGYFHRVVTSVGLVWPTPV